MLRKILDGLLFGTGFGVAFVTVWFIAMYHVLPAVLSERIETATRELGGQDTATVASVELPGRYLGSTGIYSGEFRPDNNRVLANGPGEITGYALLNDKPLEGLRFRLALNGDVMSQWTTTGPGGEYRISVPYGRYVIDGFELDLNNANRVLPGKIPHPNNLHTGGPFDVSGTQKGRGLDFRFVDPVVKRIAKNRYTPTENAVLEWEPYPNATQYTVQIYEKPDSRTWSNETLFEWQDRPVLTASRIDLREQGVELKPGYFYAVEIEARDDAGRLLSKTAQIQPGYDFEIVEQETLRENGDDG